MSTSRAGRAPPPTCLPRPVPRSRRSGTPSAPWGWRQRTTRAVSTQGRVRTLQAAGVAQAGLAQGGQVCQA